LVDRHRFAVSNAHIPVLLLLSQSDSLKTLNIKGMIAVENPSISVGKYVDTKHVDTVIREYKQERWVHSSERIGKEDSLSAWWSIEEIENFLAHAKDNGADGLKMYFAAYPKDYTEEPLYAGRQTLVMVATKTKVTETGLVNKDIYTATENGPNILAYNMSKLCPPMCKPGGGGISADDADWGLGLTIIDRGDQGIVVI
jgi:hypothetical protein